MVLVPCSMFFSGGILITSRLDKHGLHGLAESLKAKVPRQLIGGHNNATRSKGLVPAERIVFNQIHS